MHNLTIDSRNPQISSQIEFYCNTHGIGCTNNYNRGVEELTISNVQTDEQLEVLLKLKNQAA